MNLAEVFALNHLGEVAWSADNYATAADDHHSALASAVEITCDSPGWTAVLSG